MREIKFRAWERENYRMVYDLAVGKENAYRNCPLMQFTGLRDKNGTEIYEGDSLREKKDIMTVCVVFMDGAFWFMYDSNDRFTFDWLVGHERNKWKFEVIGNIYENPELLK
jgi:uncharacterized phage protein (TIGR01671 family)